MTMQTWVAVALGVLAGMLVCGGLWALASPATLDIEPTDEGCWPPAGPLAGPSAAAGSEVDLPAHQRLQGATEAVLALGRRYQITLADWGPEFTGEGDALHRWRWVVSDADHEVKAALGVEVTQAGPLLMLGNAPTNLRALGQALVWVEQHVHPPVQIVIDEGSLHDQASDSQVI